MRADIPFLDLRKANVPFEAETIEAVGRVISSGRYLHGPETAAFERELAEMCGVPHATGVSNGLDAIRLIFRAYIELGRLAAGDGVIVQADTYIASVLPLTELGLRPVLTDIDAATMNLDWHKAEEAVMADSGIKAIMAVHLYGSPCWNADVAQRLMERGLLIVEDNAQAVGAAAGTPSPVTGSCRTGALGNAAAFSFYPTKNIGALGDAGAVTTSDKALANAVKALANYGSDRRYHNIYRGWNCRMDELQAAALRIRLRHLTRINDSRRQKAALYTALLANGHMQLPEWNRGSVWHQYVVRVGKGRRDDFRTYMERSGIGTDIHYATPPHRQPCYASLPHGGLPVAERLAAECVSLPIASASLSDIAAVAAVANRF